MPYLKLLKIYERISDESNYSVSKKIVRKKFFLNFKALNEVKRSSTSVQPLPTAQEHVCQMNIRHDYQPKIGLGNFYLKKNLQVF